MACAHITLPGLNGGPPMHGIICGLPKPKRCSNCGAPSDRLCDWRIGATRSGKRKDCDRPICSRCSTVPAPDKDLCREHGECWAERLSRMAA